MTRDEALAMEGAHALGELPGRGGTRVRPVILVDTSAWIEYNRATGSDVHHRLRDAIGSGETLAVTEPIVAEVAAGARDDRREQQLRRLLFPVRTAALRSGHRLRRRSPRLPGVQPPRSDPTGSARL